ncbi:Nickel transporter UreH [methanotrophic endosymbiont of Bathymodiolus azoricus (Menez Gwen)]|nr:Nickel transporter UreH [methanotrophic endosymbiont of Bathymodiolus azoricus (Menez Gwen)]
MFSLLLLGFLIGMRHALEADHVAAVASLASKTTSVQSAIKQGAVWGLGHSFTLFLFSSIIILSESIIPKNPSYGARIFCWYYACYPRCRCHQKISA